MELAVIKSRSISIILLLLLLLSIPYFSKGSLDLSDKEVYEIDYRGPETHSSIPPPDHHSHGHRHWLHRETDVLPPRKSSKGSKRGGNNGRNAKKIHG